MSKTIRVIDEANGSFNMRLSCLSPLLAQNLSDRARDHLILVKSKTESDRLHQEFQEIALKDLQSVEGVGRNKAIYLLAGIDITRRAFDQNNPVITHSLYEVFHRMFMINLTLQIQPAALLKLRAFSRDKKSLSKTKAITCKDIQNLRLWTEKWKR